MAHAMSLLDQLAPRDAIEQMLAGQLILLQARIQLLNRISLTQTNTVWSHLYSSQLDRAIAGYHKALASLKDHHRPRRRRRSSITTIRTAHITAQQLIGVPIQPQALHAIPSQEQIKKIKSKPAKSLPPTRDPET